MPASLAHAGPAQSSGPAPQPSAQATVAGPIAGVSGNSINLNGGPNCGYVNVTYTSATTIEENGYSLAPGIYATVYGSGSCATSVTASAISLSNAATSTPNPGATNGSATIPQTHVPTADYLGGFAGTTSVTATTAATVLSWAEVSTQDSNAASTAGIKTLEYIDPLEQATTDPLYTSDESTFSHDCSGNRIAVPYVAGQWLMAPGSADLSSLLNNWQTAQESQGHVDAFLYDNIDDLYGLTTLPCAATQSSWDSQNASLIGNSNYPVVFNGYALNSDAASLINGATVKGAMAEECYGRKSQPSPPYTTDSTWVTDENLQLAAAAAGKWYFCYNTPTTDASQSIALRQYIYASFLLSYSPTSSVLWEYFSTPSGLHVFPETKIVPTSPLLQAPSSVSSLQSGGVYVREYGACYLAGTTIGRCAAVVNSSASSSYGMPSLQQSYSHTMAISGSGTLDGGSVSASGPAPPSSLPPETGLILTQ
ncbi:MAG: hypothetical protein ACRENA_13870 [Vulcanimicrobiaceae bacterium]